MLLSKVRYHLCCSATCFIDILFNVTTGFTIESGDSIIGGLNPSLGTLLAAALETAGYQAQSQVLNSLRPLLGQLAALIYLGVIISVVVTVALSGQYRAALWILIGPAVFFLLIHTTTNASGAEWQFGSFKDRTRSNDLGRVLKGAQVQANSSVSYTFHLYNVLISTVFQHLIGVVTNQEMLPQMRFMARQRVLDDLFGVELNNPNLKGLLSFFYAHCHQEIGYATMIAIGNREQRRINSTGANYLGFRASPEYRAAVENYCDRFPRRDKPFPPGPWQQYVVTPPPEGLGESPSPGVSVLRFRVGEVSHATVSCAQLWRWVVLGARKQIGEHTQLLRKIDVDPYGERVFGAQFWENLLKDVGAQVGGLGKGHNLDPCPNVAERFADQLNNSIVNRFFAGMLIRDQLVHDPRGMMMEQFTEHGRITIERSGSAGGSDPNKKEKILRRLRAQELAESQKYEALWLLLALPYLQGVILFALAVTFPFFAMTTLLPGQAGSFFMWMALWAWAKSWDLGWALIMVADNVLWELLPHVSYYDFPGNNEAASSEYDTPVNLLESMFSGDHSYSLGAYWLLLSLMIGAVPVLTAQAVLGSKKALAGVLVDGLRIMGAKLGSTAADWLAHEQIERNDVRTVAAVVSDVKNKLDAAFAKDKQRFEDDRIKYMAMHKKALAVAKAVADIGSGSAKFVFHSGAEELNSLTEGELLSLNEKMVKGLNTLDSEVLVPVQNRVADVYNVQLKSLTKELEDIREAAVAALAEGGLRHAANAGRGMSRAAGHAADFGSTVGMVGIMLAPKWTPDWVKSTGLTIATFGKATGKNLVQDNQHIPKNLVERRTREQVDADIENLMGTLPRWNATPITPATVADLRRRVRESAEELNEYWLDHGRKIRLMWDGFKDQLGLTELFLRDKFEDLHAEVNRHTVNGLNAVISGATGRQFSGLEKLYYQRTPLDELERRTFFGLSKSMDDVFAGSQANKELDHARAEIERVRRKAYGYEFGAEVTAWGSITIGAVVGYFNPAVGITIGLTGVHAAYQINSTAIDIHRVVNSKHAELIGLNGEQWLYNSFKSNEWYFSQEIRAGISLRGEWWNIPENPCGIMGNADQLTARLRIEASNLEGGLVGDIAWTAIFGLTRGKTIL